MADIVLVVVQGTADSVSYSTVVIGQDRFSVPAT